MTLKQATPKLQEMCFKHERLMWYARKDKDERSPYWDGIPEHIKRGAFESMANVERDYPIEVADLDGDDSAWHHGFNSGVVAAIRYVWELLADGEEVADENFPSLYT